MIVATNSPHSSLFKRLRCGRQYSPQSRRQLGSWWSRESTSTYLRIILNVYSVILKYIFHIDFIPMWCKGLLYSTPRCLILRPRRHGEASSSGGRQQKRQRWGELHPWILFQVCCTEDNFCQPQARKDNIIHVYWCFLPLSLSIVILSTYLRAFFSMIFLWFAFLSHTCSFPLRIHDPGWLHSSYVGHWQTPPLRHKDPPSSGGWQRGSR